MSNYITKTLYFQNSDPLVLISNIISTIEKMHPNELLEITKLNITAGLPHCDYGQTVEIEYIIRSTSEFFKKTHFGS